MSAPQSPNPYTVFYSQPPTVSPVLLTDRTRQQQLTCAVCEREVDSSLETCGSCKRQMCEHCSALPPRQYLSFCTLCAVDDGASQEDAAAARCLAAACSRTRRPGFTQQVLCLAGIEDHAQDFDVDSTHSLAPTESFSPSFSTPV